jgi:ribonuclease III family protein
MFKEICNKDPKHLSNLVLAYVGDSVFELYTRLYMVNSSNDLMKGLHRKTISIVSAKGQAASTRIIMESLTEDEIAIFKRGRNTHTRSMSKNADAVDYQTATGIESLIGYLYLSKKEERLKEIITMLIESGLNANSESGDIKSENTKTD